MPAQGNPGWVPPGWVPPAGYLQAGYPRAGAEALFLLPVPTKDGKLAFGPPTVLLSTTSYMERDLAS